MSTLPAARSKIIRNAWTVTTERLKVLTVFANKQSDQLDELLLMLRAESVQLDGVVAAFQSLHHTDYQRRLTE